MELGTLDSDSGWVCGWAGAIFSGIYKNFVRLLFFTSLIIWLLDVQHRLGQAHTHSMTTGSPMSQRSQIISRVCVCVLNFYDFIIPYFKPFVHCCPSSSSSSIDILWGVVCMCVRVSEWVEGKWCQDSTNRFCIRRLDSAHTSQLLDILGSAPLTSLM
jgi:hypothetical protein